MVENLRIPSLPCTLQGQVYCNYMVKDLVKRTDSL